MKQLALGIFGLLAFVCVVAGIGGGHRVERTYSPPAATYAAPAVAYTAPAPDPAATYIVRPNDGLWKIANEHHVTLAALMAANGFATSDVTIYPGQVLQLPGDATTGTAEPPAPAPQPPAYATAPGYSSPVYAQPSQPVYGGGCVGGNGYGEVSPVTGLPRTEYVHGYTRRDGTYVAPYYRSHR